MKKKTLPEISYLKECFEIDSGLASGLRWRLRPESHFKRDCDKTLNKKLAGTMAGCKYNNYFRVHLRGQKLTVHRVIYAMYYNEIGDFYVDHIDRNPANNSPSNLRKATNQENARNSKHRSNNTSGVKGVYWVKGKEKWAAQIVDGKRIFLGYYADFDAAVAARKLAEVERFGSFCGE